MSSPSASPSASPLARTLRQIGLFLTGASFLAASVAVSRRAVLRRGLDALPAFYTSNRRAPAPDGADGFGLALHALGLATLNVMSFGVMITGRIALAFDLCSVAELRARTQAALQRPSNTDPEAEREMEEVLRSWMGKLGLDATPSGRDATRQPRESEPLSEKEVAS